MNSCLFCNDSIPEGRQICPSCEKSLTTTNKCHYPPNVSVFIGEHEVDPCVYEDIQIITNATVIISKCSRCGELSISWRKTKNTEIINLEE